MKAPGHTPTTEIPTSRTAPVVCGKLRSGLSYLMSYFNNHCCLHTAFLFRNLRGVFSIFLQHLLNIRLEGNRAFRMHFLQILFPIDPPFHKRTIIDSFLEDDPGHGARYLMGPVNAPRFAQPAEDGR